MSDDWADDLHGDGIHYIEDYDMNFSAPLEPIMAQIIKIPTYQNDRIRSFADWYRANEPALTE